MADKVGNVDHHIFLHPDPHPLSRSPFTNLGPSATGSGSSSATWKHLQTKLEGLGSCNTFTAVESPLRHWSPCPLELAQIFSPCLDSFWITMDLVEAVRDASPQVEMGQCGLKRAKPCVKSSCRSLWKPSFKKSQIL